jgi:hypothetical protein
VTRARPLVLVCAIAAAAAALSFRPIYEPDLWWHLAQGREAAAGRIVRTNLFSFTYPDYRQHFTTWGFDLLAFSAWSAAGGPGVQLLQFALIALTLGMLYRACRTRAPAWSAAAVLFLAVFVLEPRAIPRPHVASFAGMALGALTVERATERRSAGPLVWTIPLVAIWSNVHVESVFGVLFVGLFAAGEWLAPASLDRREARRAVTIAAGSGLATLATPYGVGLPIYLYENLSVPQILAIAELRPAYLPDYRAYYLFVGVAAALFLLQFRTLRLWEAAALVVFAAMGFRHLRLTPLVVLAMAPAVAARVAALAQKGVDYRAILITACFAALASSRIPLPVLVRGFAIGTPAVRPPEFFSPGAIEFIRRNGLEGPVFNSHNLGGYLAWTLYPGVRIFQDSRLQAYPPEHFRGIMAASASQRDWDALVAPVDWAVLSVPRPNQLSGAGRFPASEWKTVYEDDAIEIAVRRSGEYARLPAVNSQLATPNSQAQLSGERLPERR